VGAEAGSHVQMTGAIVGAFGTLGVSLKGFSAEALAVPFTVLDRKKYDKR